jgi:predicted helicase
MHSAVAFCQNIAISKATAQAFNDCREAYFETLSEEQRKEIVTVEADHVDGAMGAQTREKKLRWLKSTDVAKPDCHILNNVRCLSEGVDVPSLDAVMFLSARNSQIDVVQSVGRVMRKAPGKKYGYIIIPVVILPSADPEKVLASDRFNVVWTVLNALRAHDDRFNATINKIELNKKKPDTIRVTGTSIGGPAEDSDGESGGAGAKDRKIKSEFQKQMELEFARFQGVIYARMVQKCGNRLYWEQWAADVAKIAERHIEQISAIVSRNGKAQDEFTRYLAGLRKNINPSVTEKEAVEMLAQHIITQPVFEALFEDYSFVKNNPVSQSMQGIINILNEKTTKGDAEKLDRFYVSVRKRAEGIDNGEAKQRIISDLYDKFFRTAFPLVTEKLGIVYTPVEIVDFIIRSVEDVLQKEFGRSLTDENVHILDPFTGTGTFITRLLQSGIIHPEDLERKYTKEIHANEIMLLAYYIASINIENVYHDLLHIADPYNQASFDDTELYAADIAQFPIKQKGKKRAKVPEYVPFNGICLTDTFQLGETKEGESLFSEIFPQNSRRVQEQQKTPLRVIIGNPPYSRGQQSINDDAKNQNYPRLEKRIKETYAKDIDTGLQRDLYNSYIKAFRWSADRIDPKHGGIIAYISNNGWIEKNYASGLRKAVEKEFSSVYIYNLMGNKRGLSREESKRQGDNVFDIMTGVGITVFVKKPNQTIKGSVFYYVVDDYMNRNEKLRFLSETKQLNKVKWETVAADEYGDWLHRRNDVFTGYIPIEPILNKEKKCLSFFTKNPVGLSSNRKDWVYNYSTDNLTMNIKNMIRFYNSQRKLYQNTNTLDMDPSKIKWTENLIRDVKNNILHSFHDNIIVNAVFTPFTKMNLYYFKPFIERPGKWDELFPNSNVSNFVIITPGKNGRKEFSTLITNIIPDLNYFDGGAQCFPLYWYEKKEKIQRGLFEQVEDEYIRHDAVSDFILEQAQARYGPRITKKDIFYYVYGILHSPTYRTTFANDLKKTLPRLPLVEKPTDFWAFSEAGRKLADLHLNYEEQPKPAEVKVNVGGGGGG